jgi:hypothetical protein
MFNSEKRNKMRSGFGKKKVRYLYDSLGPELRIASPRYAEWKNSIQLNLGVSGWPFLYSNCHVVKVNFTVLNVVQIHEV